MHIYIYIYIEREREQLVYIYIYIHSFIYIYIYIYPARRPAGTAGGAGQLSRTGFAAENNIMNLRFINVQATRSRTKVRNFFQQPTFRKITNN